MPIAVPVAVRNFEAFPAWLSARPIPKSEILTPPSPVTITFSGFMSRWTIPRLAACWRPGEQPLEHAADLRERQVADERPQRPALDVLHRDVRRPLVLEVVVDGDDVRVAQRAGHPRLAQEALGEGLVGGMEARELLQRDVPVEVGLAREVDGRHPAAPDLLQQLVAPDALEDQRQGGVTSLVRPGMSPPPRPLPPELSPISRLARARA